MSENFLPPPSSPGRPPLERREVFLIIAAGFCAFLAKLALAWQTTGSNDVGAFWFFSDIIERYGAIGAYHLGPVYNHPPLVGGFLLTIRWLTEHWHWPFPFLLRFPGIVADFLLLLILLWHSARSPLLRCPRWVWLVFALSPVSLMVSGFHGNTDSILVLPLLLAALMCGEDRPAASGLFLALSLHIKVVALIVAPILFFHWLARGKVWKFSGVCALVLLVGWAEPLLSYPLLFLKNVLGYSSSWGIWGITYWCHLIETGLFPAHFPAQIIGLNTVIVVLLKCIILGLIALFGWRTRKAPGGNVPANLAVGWLIFFAFSPGVGPQYLVWPACFLLFLSSRWYLLITAASSCYLFFFYNIICKGLPWDRGIANLGNTAKWVPWTIWPWLTFCAALYSLWKRSRKAAG